MRLFRAGELDRVVRNAMFDQLKIFDEVLVFKMFEEFDDVVASVELFIAATIFEAAFKEKVIESDGVRKLGMSFNFNDTTHDIIFKFDIHFSILLFGHVKKFSVERHELILKTSDLPERRLIKKLNNSGSFAVDRGFGNSIGRQKRGNNFKGFAVVAVGFFAVIGHVNIGLEEHELIDTVQYVGKLVFTGLGFGTFVNFTSKAAINDAGSDETVADVIFGDTNAENVEVKLLNGFGKSERRMLVNEDSERGKDFSEFLVIFNLDELFGLIAVVHVLIHFDSKSSDFFGEAIVGKENDFGRVSLNIFFALNEFHTEFLPCKMEKI